MGDPHIELVDKSFEASGTAVTACPVSAEDFGGGCYRDEIVRTNGSEEHVVSLDTQPCVECGTCAIVADTEWEHPAGGKGVEFCRGDPFGDEWPVRRPPSGALPPGRADPRVAGSRPAGQERAMDSFGTGSATRR